MRSQQWNRSQELVGEVWPDDVPSMFIELPADPASPRAMFSSLRPTGRMHTYESNSAFTVTAFMNKMGVSQWPRDYLAGE